MAAHWPAAWQPANAGAPDLILPVPLHGSRIRERGYNQSALLARLLGVAVETLRKRKGADPARATRPQVGLNAAARGERRRRVCTAHGDVVGRHIVLVDDVCTTGATLEACAAALKAAGAASVRGYTLSRAQWEPLNGAPEDA